MQRLIVRPPLKGQLFITEDNPMRFDNLVDHSHYIIAVCAHGHMRVIHSHHQGPSMNLGAHQHGPQKNLSRSFFRC